MSEQMRKYGESSSGEARLPADAVGAYFTIASQYELLNKDQEQELGHRIQAGLALSPHLEALDNPADLSQEDLQTLTVAKQARDDMVLHNLRFVERTASKFLWSGLGHEDLLHEGVAGLVTAAERFDPDKGYKFSTFAENWISNRIKSACGDTARLIRIPKRQEDNLYKLRKKIDADPSTDFNTACHEAGFGNPQLALDALEQSRPVLSFAMPVDNNGGACVMGDLIAEKPTDGCAHTVEQDYRADLLILGIQEALANDCMAKALVMRAEGASQAEVASQLGVTTGYIYKLVKKARERLQHFTRDELYQLGKQRERSIEAPQDEADSWSLALNSSSDQLVG